MYYASIGLSRTAVMLIPTERIRAVPWNAINTGISERLRIREMLNDDLSYVASNRFAHI